MRHTELFTGRIGRISAPRELNGGNCVVNFSVAETPREKRDGNWVDGETIWTNVTIFGDEARNLHRSVVPGTFVTVVGYRNARKWTPEGKEEQVSQQIVAEHVAISITKFNYVEKIGNVNYKNGGAATQTQAQQGAPANNADPFGGSGDSGTDPFGGGADDNPFNLNQ